MNLHERLNDAMKEAMKARDSLRLNAIRLIRTAIKNREIDARKTLGDEEIVGVLSSLVKQRRESVQMYRENNRPDLAEKEEQELAVVHEFLPTQLTENEIAAIIEEAVASTGATSMREMGQVMKAVTGRTVGRADGRQVSEMVKARLARG